MFLIWGKKLVRRRIGYVADYCPICRGLRSFKVKRVGAVPHIYYFSLGREGDLVGYTRTCAGCNIDLDARPDLYLGIHPHMLPPEELAAATNPDWRLVHAERLKLEATFAADPAALTPQQRAMLLQEPVALLAPKAEERFRSSHFDRRTFGMLLGMVVLVALAAALGNAFPGAKDTLMTGAVLAGIAGVAWQAAQIKHRWFREVIFPTLVPALRPLRPTPQEIEALLRESRRRGEQFGRKLDPARLIAALAADPARRSPAEAAQATTAVFPPGSLPRGSSAPTPHPAPTPPPEPAPARGTDTASPARALGLKLKYGGIRHRVTAADGEIMIGRAPDANIVVSEQHVSRHHASVIWDDYGRPLLVNLSQLGTSLQVDGAPAPERVDTSTRLRGQGRIGLSGDYAYAEAQKIVVAYEVKGDPGA